jgi:outer membrane lipoprotein carrier protein
MSASTTTTPRPARFAALALALGATAFALPAAAGAADPWQALRELRRELAAAGELQATFTQRYVPAGFEDGDAERGAITVGLPDCLRWDYAEPYPKSYLLCGSRLHAWTRGEPQGQRMSVDPEGQPGLDLLLLPAEELASRYTAETTTGAAGRTAIVLRPAKPEAALADATFELDPKTRRPAALAYRDREGNTTRFEFGEFRKVDDAAIFTPPPAVEWKEP